MDLSSLAPSLPSTSTSSASISFASSTSEKACRSCDRPLVRSLLCSRCKGPYCSVACQKKDWKLHKKSCRVYYPPSSSKDQGQVFPNEIFHNILEFIFLRPSSTTPSSDPFHLNGTTHLLLVSSSFLTLSLPLLYQSVTISRPSHYVKFFDPEKGLFVAGKDSKRRWGFVRELKIVSDVQPPPEVYFEDGDYIVPLAFPPFSQNLTQVCVLESIPWSVFNEMDRDGTLWLNQPGAKELLARIQEDQGERKDAEMSLGELHRGEGLVYPNGQLIPFDDWITTYTASGTLDAAINLSIAGTIEELLQNEQDTFFDELIFTTAPRILRLRWPSPRTIMKWCSPPQGCEEVKTLAIHYDPAVNKGLFNGLYAFAQEVGSGSNIGHVELVGYPPEKLVGFVEWIKTRKPSKNKDRIERWTWTQEDGTIFELRITENVWIRPQR